MTPRQLPRPLTTTPSTEMRRFTRLTNGFSKKLGNHAAAVSLHFLYVNWARPHKTLANPPANPGDGG